MCKFSVKLFRAVGFIACLTSVLTVGCSTIGKAKVGNGWDGNGHLLYLNAPEIQRSNLDNFLLKHPEFNEEAKIQYLLSCVQNSKFRFVRNGIVFDGQNAAKWLQRKRKHPQYKEYPIITANDFINRVADGAKASRRPYEVVMADGQRQHLKMLLNNELTRLEAAAQLSSLEKSLSESVSGENERPTDVSYSAVPVGVHAS